LLFSGGALVVGYALGLIGTLWDYQQHLAGLHDETPHITFHVGTLLVLAVLVGLTPLWPRRSGYLASYTLMSVGVAIGFGSLFWLEGLMMQHVTMADPRMMEGQLGMLVGALVFLVLIARTLWVLAWSNRGLAAAAVGILIVLGGYAFDLVWHQMQLGGEMEEMGGQMNMLVMPPHQLILAGWAVGLIASSVVLLQAGMVRDQNWGAA